MTTKPSMKQLTGPQVLMKIEILMVEVMKTLRNYPKAEKYTLAERTEKALLDGVQDIYYATFIVPERLRRLESARVHFQMMLFLFRSARKQGFISEEYYEKTAMDFDEVGKMLSGWIKTIQNKNAQNKNPQALVRD